METNIKNFNAIGNEFENLLHKLNYEFTKLDFEDNDLNYMISVENKTLSISKINLLMYLQEEDFSLRLLQLNIYDLSDKGDITPFYKITNLINSDLNNGKFVIHEKVKQIIYLDSIYCGNGFSELSERKIKILIDNAINNIIIFLRMMSSKEK